MLFERKNIVQGQFTDPVFFDKKRYRVVLLVMVLAMSIAFSWYISKNEIIIQVKNNNLPVMFVDIPDGRWNLSYTHSVQKTKVEEFFKVQGENEFLLYETRYSSYGVGLPFLASDGKLTILDDGRMQLEMQRKFPVVKVWTGEEAKVKLQTKNETLDLYKIFPVGSLLEISTLPRYKILINKFLWR